MSFFLHPSTSASSPSRLQIFSLFPSCIFLGSALFFK
jgi:hypothetical protein